ncbi:hypothetical protein C9374_007140 [Naegleria lovaniensis]|uniref:Uncharacterized protein n=1 Tax=Naegleria lovaniensis TaxID=51637 RepID=A0AA88KSE6_NAELO|nr:uncharacterized protein C9374_007140 [Naegleria lovaniensis]KAG2393609.1 hypothetical protein C9374_007140 [Naegleria lovaniensis]
MSEQTVTYFEIDGNSFVVYSDLCVVQTSLASSSGGSFTHVAGGITPITTSLSSDIPSTLYHTNNTITNNHSISSKKIIKLTISDGENIYYNHHSISYAGQASSGEEFNMFQIVHTSIMKQDNSKFKYRVNYMSNGNLNFIISMIVNPSGDYIISNIELKKSSNTKAGHISLFRYLIISKENDEKTINKLSKQAKHYNESIEQSKLVVEEKERMEKELYGQFLILINSKKKIIQKFHEAKKQSDELLDKEKEKNKILTDEKKQLQQQIEQLKQQLQAAKSAAKNSNNMLFRGRLVDSPQLSPSCSAQALVEGYQTPRKPSRNAKCVDAEDLLDDLTFE